MMFSGTGIAPNCRDDNHVQCRGWEFTRSADLPYECTCWHHNPPACLDDAEPTDDPDRLDYFPASEENRGDAIRQERFDA